MGLLIMWCSSSGIWRSGEDFDDSPLNPFFRSQHFNYRSISRGGKKEKEKRKPSCLHLKIVGLEAGECGKNSQPSSGLIEVRTRAVPAFGDLYSAPTSVLKE